METLTQRYFNILQQFEAVAKEKKLWYFLFTKLIFGGVIQMGNAIFTEIGFEEGTFVLKVNDSKWMEKLCEYVKNHASAVAELRINSRGKLDLWITESRTPERIDKILVDDAFSENFEQYRSAFEQNWFPDKWVDFAKRLCMDNDFDFGQVEAENVNSETMSEMEKTNQEASGTPQNLGVNKLESARRGKNKVCLANFGGKEILAKIFKDSQTDEVKVAVWTKGAEGESREKIMTKGQVMSGSTALSTIMTNYDIKYERLGPDGKIKNVKKETVNVAYELIRELLREAQELEDPDLGFNVSEIHQFVISEIEKGFAEKREGCHINIAGDTGLIGCTRKVLEEILEDTGWEVSSLCKSLRHRKLMRTDKAAHRRQLTISDGSKIYAFKRGT